LLEDGRRHVGEFLFAGDLFGCDSAQQYEFGAEAVTAATLRRYRASAIEDRADTDLAFAQRLRRHSASEVRVARGRLMLLGRKTASERIASFLIEMQTRLRPCGPGAIDLPMSRGDIADYLGLTIETICRGLAELRQLGIIAVARTRIVVLDRCGLARAGSDQVH
jgi:CRP-like cAMP-binding protein